MQTHLSEKVRGTNLRDFKSVVCVWGGVIYTPGARIKRNM